MAPLTVPPSLAKSASVPCPASIMRASMVPVVEGLMGAAAMRMLNEAGETAVASAETGSHMLSAVKGSTLTFSMPTARNFLAAHSMARPHAAEPVGRPPMPSESSRKSVISGVSPCARAARRCGGSCANKTCAAAITINEAQWGGRPRPRRTPWSGSEADGLPTPVVTINHPILHHEHYLLHLPDILNRIPGNNHNVGQFSSFQRADFVLQSQ